MACIRDKNVVDIPTLAKTIPPNPLLGYAGSGTAPASAASGSSKGSSTQSTLRHRVLLYDQRCFVTGAVSNQLEACHLINAIRMDKSNRTTKKPLKDQVVSISSFPTRQAVTEFSRPGAHPHPATVWAQGLRPRQPPELYFT